MRDCLLINDLIRIDESHWSSIINIYEVDNDFFCVEIQIRNFQATCFKPFPEI